MDELEQMKAMIDTFRETLLFLTEQEKKRGEEVAALNEKIEAVNTTLTDSIIKPSLEAYKEEQFNGFKEKYGDRLSQYDKPVGIAMNEPGYDATREAFNALEDLPAEDREGYDVDGYVNKVEEGLKGYLDEIKASLGIPDGQATEVKEDAEGNVSVKTDADGDGTPEATVAEEKDVESAPEGKAEEIPADEESDEDEIDPELKRQLENY